ncbi:MAG TPA: NADPH-dependent F420 reductase [Thermoleophilaceae bacterium]
MKIGIVGAGHIGATLAQHFVNAGHEVAISNSRGPGTLRELEAQLGERARATTADEAARFGDLVVVAIPFKDYREVSAEAVAGKVVVDTMNYYPTRDGHFAEFDSGETTSSELFQQHLPDSFVVKAFNSIRWDTFRDKARPGDTEGHIGIPISGDDLAAKQEVDDLIVEIGFDAVDAGPLGEGGRKHQVGSELYGAELSSAELADRLAR